MKVCPICGSKFSGSEMFCPHDGASLVGQDSPAELVGQTLHGLVGLETFLFRDAFGERYVGDMLGSGHRVRVTVFNQAFAPTTERVAALASTKALLDTPLPPQVSSTYSWDLESSPAFLLETAPEGPTLRLLLEERGRLDWRTALKITCALARTLDWMDTAGVVHRALSPSAIHVTDIKRGDAQLSEWGLGVLAYQENPLEALKQGQLVCGAAYMAPELIDGGQRADRKSTIYSLGVLLYEMLTGKSPYHSDDAEETLKRQRRERPVKLSIAAEERDLPDALDDLFEVITDKRPDKRFQTLEAMLNALSSMLDDGTSASDFPPLVRAEEEPNVLARPNSAHAPASEEEKPNSKKTLLFISAEEIARASREASEATAPSIDEGAPATEEAEQEDAGPTMLEMDRGVLDEDAARHEARGEDASSSEDATPQEDTEHAEAQGAQENAGEKKRRRKKKKKKHEETSPSTDEGSEQETLSEDVDDAKKSTVVISKDFAEEAKQATEPSSSEPAEGATGGPSASVVIDEELLAEADEAFGAPSKERGEEAAEVEEDDKNDEDERGAPEKDGDTASSERRRRKKKKSSPSSSRAASTDDDAATDGTKERAPEESDAPQEAEQRDEGEGDAAAQTKAKPTSKKKRRKNKKNSSKKAADLKDEAADEDSADEDGGDAGAKNEPADEHSPREDAPALAAAEVNFNSQWFIADTEDAWDREVLREHAARMDRRVRNILYVVLGVFLIAVVGGVVWLVFFMPTPSEEDEEVHLLDDTPPSHRLATLAPRDPAA